MRACAIIGAGYGDEGKGLMTDFFCHRHLNESPIVIRYNGGAQAGHTVVAGEHKHVFSHFGAGTLLGVDTYLSSDFIVNPILFMMETEALVPILQSTGKKISIFIHGDCKVTTIYDMLANQAIEKSRATRHGSCGVGIHETILRSMSVPFDVKTIAMSKDEEILKILSDIENYYKKRLSSFGVEDSTSLFEIARERAIHFIEDCRSMLRIAVVNHVNDSNAFLRCYSTLIFEGAQGLLLSEAHGVAPHLTPSDPGCSNVLKMCNELKITDVTLCYVTRVYTTRHGSGPLKNEMTPGQLGIFDEALENETNTQNEFQGVFRYSPLDVDSIASAIISDASNAQKFSITPKIELSTTCIDQIRASSFVSHYIADLNDLIDDVAPSTLYTCRGPSRETVTIVENP